MLTAAPSPGLPPAKEIDMKLINMLSPALLGILLANPAQAMIISAPDVSICQYKGPDNPGCGVRPPPCYCNPCCEYRPTPYRPSRSQYVD